MLGKQMFALLYRGVTQIKLISVTNPYSGKHPQSRFFCVIKGGAEVFCEPTGSQVPLAQNNPYAKVAHLGGSCPKPLHWIPNANISAIGGR